MGFLAVLAACLFAVFIFTVFGGYSLLLWCQQSLWMVVPPALVLAVLVWTFLKWTIRSPPCKSGWTSWKRHRKTPKSPRNKYSAALAGEAFPAGAAHFYTLFFILRVIQPFKHHHAQTDKTGAQRKTDCPHRHTEQNAHGNAEQDARDLAFLQFHLTALPFRTMQRTAATREHTAPARPPAPAANRWRAGCCSAVSHRRTP